MLTSMDKNIKKTKVVNAVNRIHIKYDQSLLLELTRLTKNIVNNLSIDDVTNNNHKNSSPR